VLKKNNVVNLKDYKKQKKKTKTKRWLLKIPIYLSIISVLYALLYFVGPSKAGLDIKTTHEYLYK
jgi:hypothetical protein